MYNQVSGNEESEQTHQDANYQFMQQPTPYFMMYNPQTQQMDNTKHKSESPQNDAKVNPYPYLPGYQSQYPQSYVFGHPNQMMYPHYPSSGTPNNNTTHQQNQKK